MRIVIGVLIILAGYVGGVWGDLSPSTDKPGLGVTRGWYKRYLDELEMKRQAEAQGNSAKYNRLLIFWSINVHASP